MNAGLYFPVDVDHLKTQVSAGPTHGDWVEYFRAHGWADKLNPTLFFLTDWYAWQNPDWVQSHRCPYQHYLEVGRFQGRDPSPNVDIQRYREVVPDVPVETIYDLILQGHHSSTLGVFASRRELAEAQARFLTAIAPLMLRISPPSRPRRSLIVLQAGRGAGVDAWCDYPKRDWDLLLNYYDASGFRPGLGEYAVFQKGTKFSAMWMLWRRFPEILLGYDHVLFLDDDVEVSGEGLNCLFRICRQHDLDLAQMSLARGSSCNWDELFHHPGFEAPRRVSAVEIMMPVFSRRAFSILAPVFGQSISGFGLDLVWGKLMRDAGRKVAVVDAVQALHARAVDQSGGAYYRYLRSNGINAKAELWALVQDYGVSRDLVTVNSEDNSAESAMAS